MRILSLAATSLLVLLSTSLLVRAAVAPQSWEFRDGRWQQIAANATTQQSVPDEQLDRVEQLLEAKQSNSAKKLTLNWLKNHKDHAAPNRDRALYLMGEALF